MPKEEAKLDTKVIEKKPILGLLASYGDAFARKGDHHIHAKLHGVSVSVGSLKQAIKALDGDDLPDDLRSALKVVNDLL